MQPVRANRRERPRGNGGFSLLELIAVMVVVGVIAFVALPRSNNDALIVSTQAEQLAGAIRYVQSAAMSKGGAGASGRRYLITFTATTYQFSFCDVPCAGVPTGDVDPYSGQLGAVSLASGVTITLPITNLPANLVGFNALGTPFTNTAVSTALAANASIVISKGGSTRTLIIFPATGMVRLI